MRTTRRMFLGAAGLSAAAALAVTGFTPTGHAAAAAAPQGPFTAWTAYHRDPSHSGVGSVPRATTLGVAWRARLDGVAQASPLVVGGIVVVATENNTVYGIDPAGGHLRWSRHLGAPVPRSMLPCGNIPTLGITGTPVADPTSGRVFVVTTTPAGTTIRHTLVGLDSRTGNVAFSQTVDPAGQDPLVENQRGALTLSRGRVVIPFGGHSGDCGDYHGYLVSTTTSGGDLRALRVGDGGAAGMWQASGASTDSAGNVYAVTGNGRRTSGAWDGSNAVLKIDPVTLGVLSSFAPRDWAQQNASDSDLGSAGAALVGGHIFTQGKTSTGYVLDQSALGGVGGQRLTTSNACATQFGGAAVDGLQVFAACTDGIRQLTVAADSATRLGWKAPAYISGSPVIGGGEVFSLAPSSGTLYALDEASGRVVRSLSVGPCARFATPALSGNLVLVGTQQELVAVSGA